MKLPKIMQKLRLPSFGAAKNSSRTYKINIKGDEGQIVFTEFAKKDFVAMAFLKAGGALHSRINKEMLPSKWRVDEKKYLGIASSQVKPYINEVEKNVRQKHKNFTIYKHELELLEFEEIDGDYKVTSTVKIWVVV